MIVIDVVSRKHCTCKTETGKFLDNVSISKLETVIPRGHPAFVMVVSGKKRGQVCEKKKFAESLYELTLHFFFVLDM